MRPADPMTEREFVDMAMTHVNRLTRFARRLCGDADGADDLVQETFVEGIKRRSDLRDPSRLLPWLLSILRTRYLQDHRVEQRRLRLIESAPVHVDPLPDLEQEILAGSFSDEVESALAALDDDLRIAVLLSDVEGLSYEEIAQVMESPVGTVRSRVARARGHLFEALAGVAHERGIGGGRKP